MTARTQIDFTNSSRWLYGSNFNSMEVWTRAFQRYLACLKQRSEQEMVNDDVQSVAKSHFIDAWKEVSTNVGKVTSIGVWVIPGLRGS